MVHISVVVPFRSSTSVFCCTESMRFPLSVPLLFPKGGRRTHCLKSKSPPILPTEVLHTRATATGDAHTLRSTTDRGTCTTFHAKPIYTCARNESSARPHHRPTHHLRSGLPPHPAETSSSDLADNSNTLHVHNIYKVQAPPIHSPISNSATHPLKFFWLRISLRKTTAHPLSYACKQAKGFSRCKHLMRIYSQKEVALRSTATAVL